MALIILFVVVNGSKWLFGSKRLPTPDLDKVNSNRMCCCNCLSEVYRNIVSGMY